MTFWVWARRASRLLHSALFFINRKSAIAPLKERRNNSATADYYTNIYFYSDIQKKLRFFHNFNQFIKNIVQKLHKIFKISSETQMFRSNLNNSFLYMFRLFARYILLRININETYIVLSNWQIVEISK